MTIPANERLQNAQIHDARTTGKHEASKDWENIETEADARALLDHSMEQYHAATSGRSQAYWLAYWGRILDHRRADMNKRKVLPGQLRPTAGVKA